MSDPFERLRSSSSPGTPPDVDAIRTRARTIVRRRYSVLAGTGSVVLVLAIVGVALNTGPTPKTAGDTVAQADLSPTPGERSMAQYNAEDNDAASTRAGSAAPEADAAGGTSELADPLVAPAPGGAVAPAASPFKATIETSRRTDGKRGARFVLQVCNPGAEAIEVAYGSGQRFDFEVARDLDLVWLWSDGQAFTQVYGTEMWKGGECRTYEATWDGTGKDAKPEPAGSYFVTGYMTGDPAAASERQAFTLS